MSSGYYYLKHTVNHSVDNRLRKSKNIDAAKADSNIDSSESNIGLFLAILTPIIMWICPVFGLISLFFVFCFTISKGN